MEKQNKKSDSADNSAEQLPPAKKVIGKPFKSGPEWNGNKNGRPVGSISLTTMVKQELLKVDPKLKKSYLELLAKRIIISTVSKGNAYLTTHMWDRLDGKVKDNVDITTKGESLNSNPKAKEQLRAIARKIIKEENARGGE